MSPQQQAQKALHHLLIRIRDHSAVGYYLGTLTQTFELVTEAYAGLTGRDVEEIRREFTPRDPKHPGEGFSFAAPASHHRDA